MCFKHRLHCYVCNTLPSILNCTVINSYCLWSYTSSYLCAAKMMLRVNSTNEWWNIWNFQNFHKLWYWLYWWYCFIPHYRLLDQNLLKIAESHVSTDQTKMLFSKKNRKLDEARNLSTAVRYLAPFWSFLKYSKLLSMLY